MLIFLPAVIIQYYSDSSPVFWHIQKPWRPPWLRLRSRIIKEVQCFSILSERRTLGKAGRSWSKLLNGEPMATHGRIYNIS